MKENKLVLEIAVAHDEKRSPSYNKFRGEKMKDKNNVRILEGWRVTNPTFYADFSILSTSIN